MVSRSRGADLHGVARHQPVQRRQHVGALDVGVRVVDLVEHPHVQLHHPASPVGKAGAASASLDRLTSRSAATRLLERRPSTRRSINPLADGSTIYPAVAARPAAGRDRPGRLQRRPGAALRRGILRPIWRTLKTPRPAPPGGHNSARNARCPACSEGCVFPRASPLMAGARYQRFGGERWRPARPARGNGAVSVRKTSRVSPSTMWCQGCPASAAGASSCGEPA